MKNFLLMNILQKIGFFCYKILGPKKAFLIAISPFGKFIFKILTKQQKNLVIKTKYGFLININEYEYFWSGFFFLGETNPLETILVRNILKKGDTFVDVGAHMGWYSLNAASIVGNNGKVIAFEPNPSCVVGFNKNTIGLNKYKNIILEKIALSDKAKIAEFWIGDDMGGSLVKENTERLTIDRSRIESIKIKTKTFDSYIKKYNDLKIKLIKIDVEGAEVQVLKGAEKYLKKYKPDILIEVIDESLRANGSSKKELFDYLKKLSYTPFELTNDGLRKIIDINFFQQTGNIFFSKKDMKI